SVHELGRNCGFTHKLWSRPLPLPAALVIIFDEVSEAFLAADCYQDFRLAPLLVGVCLVAWRSCSLLLHWLRSLLIFLIPLLLLCFQFATVLVIVCSCCYVAASVVYVVEATELLAEVLRLIMLRLLNC
ncbi:hypothetical protein U1Q18_010073, partial [Sarracenia purpurea var. burkii]